MIDYQAFKQTVNTPSRFDLLDVPIGIPMDIALREYFYVGFRLPRRSGKSTVARRFHSDTSSLLYSKYSERLGTRFDLRNEEAKFRGKNLGGLKLNYIVLDEYTDIPAGMEMFIMGTLVPAGIIARNFKIVGLYT
jgi:hypothetical protein